MPNFIVRLVGVFDDRVKGIIPDLGTFHETDMSYVTSITGVIPRPSRDAILAAADSLIENGEVDLS